MRYWMRLSVVEKESLFQVAKHYVELKDDTAPISIQQYNSEIEEAMKSTDSGEFYTHAQVKEMSKAKRTINSHLYFCQKYGVKGHLDHLEAKGIPSKSNYKHWLLGKISFVNAIEPDTAKIFPEKFSTINWEF